ncbi:MAG: T9SS type A sorting domain-containing protein, partial [Bacteroidota bacterium]
KGNLIFPGADTDIYTYDQSNAPFKIGCIDALVFGFANFFEACDQNTIWAFDGISRVYHYDVQSNTFTQIGDLFSQTSNLFGATSFNETQAALCTPTPINPTNCTVGISSVPMQELSVFPNPSGGWLNVDVPFDPVLVHAQLFSLQGHLLMENQGSQQLDLSSFSNGIYLLKVINRETGWQQTIKVVLN